MMEMLGHLYLRCVVYIWFWAIAWKCVYIIPTFTTALDLAEKILQKITPNHQSDLVETEFSAKFKKLFDGHRKILDQSFSKSKDLGDLLRFLPGVAVQKKFMSMQGIADLYRITPQLLKRLIRSTIEPLKLSSRSHYILDDYLSGFLQDRDRSQLSYCDPTLQHIYICRHFFSLLDKSNGSDLRSWVFRLIWTLIFIILTF